MIQYSTLAPDEKTPPNTLFPSQTHGKIIIEIKTGTEDLSDCDGLWTRNHTFILGVKTADCAPICFWDEEKFGIVHAGWRGLCNGIIENMLDIFDRHGHVWIGPLLPAFEIQKDFCYESISEKFGTEFFREEDTRIIFDFRNALLSLLPPHTQYDPRSTYDTSDLASWRRDHSPDRNHTIIKKSIPKEEYDIKKLYN